MYPTSLDPLTVNHCDHGDNFLTSAHGCLLQFSYSMLQPIHSRPPFLYFNDEKTVIMQSGLNIYNLLTYNGAGSSHFLCLKRKPPPHAAEHSLQSPNGPH